MPCTTRGICGANEGKWRNEVQALIEAETPTGGRRALIAAHRGSGFRSYRTTAGADLVIRRYLEEAPRSPAT